MAIIASLPELFARALSGPSDRDPPRTYSLSDAGSEVFPSHPGFMDGMALMSLAKLIRSKVPVIVPHQLDQRPRVSSTSTAHSKSREYRSIWRRAALRRSNVVTVRRSSLGASRQTE